LQPAPGIRQGFFFPGWWPDLQGIDHEFAGMELLYALLWLGVAEDVGQ
jgi:hypothetical protein